MLHLINLLRFVRGSSGLRSTSHLCRFQACYVRNLLVFAFGLSLSKQLFGDSILCNHQKETIPYDLLQTTCLINGTFTLTTVEDASGERTLPFYHSYYQWIALMFLLEAFAFYIPYHLWARWCEPDIKGLVIDKIEQVQTVLREIDQNGHKLFYKNWLLEAIYAVHILLQAYILYKFFNLDKAIVPGHFHSWWNLQGIIDLLFPDTGKCFVDYYSGGLITTGRFYCLLSLNILYRKIFYIGYILFWICFLLQLGIVFLRNAQLLFPPLRIPRNRYAETCVNKWWAYQLALSNADGEKLWLLQRTILPKKNEYLITLNTEV